MVVAEGDVAQPVAGWGRKTEVLERLKHYLAPTPPAQRCPCTKWVLLLKASQRIGSCNAQPALISNEAALQAVEDDERVVNRKHLDIELRFEEAKTAAKEVEAAWMGCSYSRPLHRLLGATPTCCG